MSGYDLTPKLTPFLDRQLLVPLLEFIGTRDIYPKDQVLGVLANVLSKSKLSNKKIEIAQQLNQPTAELEEEKKKLEEQLNKLTNDNSQLLQFYQSTTPDQIEKLKNEKKYTTTHLIEQLKIQKPHFEQFYQFAKFQFDLGKYTEAAENLGRYAPLALDASGEKTKKYLSALWGKIAAEILAKNWAAAKADLTELKELVESGKFGSPLDQLQQRSWIIHWSLFIFFNTDYHGIVDFFFETNYLNAIQTTCPHVLRYLAIAVITNTNNRRHVEDLVRVLQQEQSSYQDPLTEFVQSLLVQFDFDEAQAKLKECESVIKNDFFLSNHAAAFLESARAFIFETYCRIHSSIDIQELAEKLSFQDKEQAELWIVNLIRNAKLDAKIDSSCGKVTMGVQYPSIHEQIIEKTKNVYFQSSHIASYLLQD